MEDRLAIIKSIKAEHVRVGAEIRLVGESLNDMEAILNLQRTFTNWSQTSAEALVEKKDRIQQALNALDRGLASHFAFEEKALPPLFGELLMRALLLEHHEIRQQIGLAKAAVADTRLEGLGQREILARKSHIQEMISRACQLVQEHAAREETVLQMLEKAVTEKGEAKAIG